ncbi:MAG: hypothetical protein HY532_04910 [Chloroflexi bacterium]|nr:hypothetical protein [Chloroflexota bacterium]
MVSGLSRAAITRETDPHDWNSIDHYMTIHEKRLAEHPFVDQDIPNTLLFEEIDGGVPFLLLRGELYCHSRIVLEVEKVFELRRGGNRPQMRGVIYKYVGYARGGNLLLKYHNLHEDPDIYIHRAYDPRIGRQLLYEELSREQFPTFTEVLDEMEQLVQLL